MGLEAFAPFFGSTMRRSLRLLLPLVLAWPLQAQRPLPTPASVLGFVPGT